VDLQFDLSVASRPSSHAIVEQPFTLGLKVRVSNQSDRPRRVRLGVQHVQHHSDRSVEAELATALTSRQAVQSSQPLSRSASVPSPLVRQVATTQRASMDGSSLASTTSDFKPSKALPPPIPLANPYAFLVREREKALPSESVVHLGGSLQDLGDIELAEAGGEGSIATRDFSVGYMLLEKGIARLGGVRLLLLSEEGNGQGTVVKEVDVIAEVWVSGGKAV
jgi:hypothetical protein